MGTRRCLGLPELSQLAWAICYVLHVLPGGLLEANPVDPVFALLSFFTGVGQAVHLVL